MRTLELYLVRHEKAEPAEIDSHRTLTREGRLRAKQTGRLLAEQVPRIDWIYTSPLVRAVQTAEIIAGSIGFEDVLVVDPQIAGPTTLNRLIQMIDDTPQPAKGVAIVGHEPTLGALANQLFRSQASLRGLRTGTVLALEYGEGKATFRWAITPDGPKRVDQLSLV